MLMNHLLNPIEQTPTYKRMSQEFDFTNHLHHRLNPLTNSYVLCLPHRAKRPWQGAKEEVKKDRLPDYDPKCYLCPGNIRATGDSNPKYNETYIFDNDYPAVKLDQPNFKPTWEEDLLELRLMQTEGVKGKCFVICFSPNHNLLLPLMLLPQLTGVVDAWQLLYAKCREDAASGSAPYKYLQIFENKGFAMGCLNPHPHGQAWCLDITPLEVLLELQNMAIYYKKYGTHLLGDYVKLELKHRQRIVCENDLFLCVVPYWALWPFETMVVAKEHLRLTQDFSSKHKEDLAAILKEVTTKYDNLFNTLFPYSMGLHQAPFDCACTEGESDVAWFHIHFYPPLLRSATVRKFCVGFEMLGEPQRDLTSEQAAARLQDLDGTMHYMNK